MSDETHGYLRIYFDDDTWATVPAKQTSTARQMVELLCRKRRVAADEVADCALFACELSDERAC